MPSGMSAGDGSTALEHAAPLPQIAILDLRAAEATATVFRTLGNARRLQILSLLLEKGPLSRTQLAQATHVSRNLLVHHVVALEQDGFLTVTYPRREAVYAITPGLLTTLAGLCAPRCPGDEASDSASPA